jgi:hypothetical protein
MHEEVVANQNQNRTLFFEVDSFSKNKHGCALKWHDNVLCNVYKWNIPDKKS